MSNININEIFEEINKDIISFCEDTSININQKIIKTNLIFESLPINEETLLQCENTVKKYFSEFIESEIQKTIKKKNFEKNPIKNFLNFYKKIQNYKKILKIIFSNQLRYIPQKKINLQNLKLLFIKQFFFERNIWVLIKNDFNKIIRNLRINEILFDLDLNNFLMILKKLIDFENIEISNFISLISENIENEIEKYLIFFEDLKNKDFFSYLKKLTNFFEYDFDRIFFYKGKENLEIFKNYLKKENEFIKNKIILDFEKNDIFEKFYFVVKKKLGQNLDDYFEDYINFNLKKIDQNFIVNNELVLKLKNLDLKIRKNFKFLSEKEIDIFLKKGFYNFYIKNGELLIPFLIKKLDKILKQENLEKSKKEISEIISVYNFIPEKFNFEEIYLENLKKRNLYKNRIDYEIFTFNHLQRYYPYFSIKIELLINDLIFSKKYFEKNPKKKINLINKYNWDVDFIDKEFNDKIFKEINLFSKEEMFDMKKLIDENLNLKRQKWSLNLFLTNFCFEILFKKKKFEIWINSIQFLILKFICENPKKNFLNFLQNKFIFIDKLYIKVIINLFLEKKIILQKQNFYEICINKSFTENLAEILNDLFEKEKLKKKNEIGKKKFCKKPILALITKFMKSKKKSNINNIIDLIKKNSSFNFEIDNLIEILVDKDIIERDQNNSAIIIYNEF